MKNYIGIDVAKAKVDIFSLEDSTYLTVANDEESLTKELSKFASPETLIVLENTGGHEKTCIKVALKLNFKLHRTDNIKFKKFAGYRGKKAKTDKIDARKLALYGKDGCERNDPEAPFKFYEPLEDIQEEIKQLSRYLNALIGDRAAARCRLKSPGCNLVVDYVKKTIEHLDSEISSLEEKLESLIIIHQETKEKYEKLMEYKGVAEKTATRLIANLPELGTVSKREIAVIGGLAPHAKDSGKSSGYRSTKGSGRNVIREILFMPTSCAIQHTPEIKRFYERLIAKGKKEIVALTACMRKILVQLNAILRKKLKRKEEEKAAAMAT
ncbi:IS110 family transposase [Alphaproteobacteria bacterium]|nr:IS110 family transposase [Alphaproteobacteria bacterium]